MTVKKIAVLAEPKIIPQNPGTPPTPTEPTSRRPTDLQLKHWLARTREYIESGRLKREAIRANNLPEYHLVLIQLGYPDDFEPTPEERRKLKKKWKHLKKYWHLKKFKNLVPIQKS